MAGEWGKRERNANGGRLAEWLHKLRNDHADRILPITAQIAAEWGRIAASRPRGDVDGLIAATAIVHDLIIVTRSVADFNDTGASVIERPPGAVPERRSVVAGRAKAMTPNLQRASFGPLSCPAGAGRGRAVLRRSRLARSAAASASAFFWPLAGGFAPLSSFAISFLSPGECGDRPAPVKARHTA
jgi:hypothetical protein